MVNPSNTVSEKPMKLLYCWVIQPTIGMKDDYYKGVYDKPNHFNLILDNIKYREKFIDKKINQCIRDDKSPVRKTHKKLPDTNIKQEPQNENSDDYNSDQNYNNQKDQSKKYYFKDTINLNRKEIQMNQKKVSKDTFMKEFFEKEDRYCPNRHQFSFKWFNKFLRGEKKLLRKSIIKPVDKIAKFEELKIITLLKYGWKKLGRDRLDQYLPDLIDYEDINKVYLVNVLNTLVFFLNIITLDPGLYQKDHVNSY